jgi:Fe2+ or Zn2+ uptake regulation protein
LIEEFPLIKKLLERKGYKFTVQRRIILEELLKAGRHINIEEIHEKIKKRNIGLATIYRTLEVFADLGIAKEINVDGISYYEQKLFSKKPLHIHFKCDKCDSIIDIDDKEAIFEYIKLNNMIEEHNKIQIHDMDIMLLGICQKCLEGT